MAKERGQTTKGTNGGSFRKSRHDEPPGGLAQPALERGRRYKLTYLVGGPGGQPDTETASFLYAGEQGDFVVSDEGLMIRKDSIVSARADDPYERARRTADPASPELRLARSERVGWLVREADPLVTSVSFEHEPRGRSHHVWLGSLGRARGGDVAAHDTLDHETDLAVQKCFKEMVNTEGLEPGAYEFSLGTGRVTRLD